MKFNPVLRHTHIVLMLVVGFGGSGEVLAADGVHEINQSCVATGCFPGDDPGFPVEVTQEGSYLLTSNLDVRLESNPEDVTAILVNSPLDAVVIDLNGFVILGPTGCTGDPVTFCTPTGAGIGIDMLDNHVTIRNGTVTGMGDAGIRAVTASKIENMIVKSCGGDAILAGAGSFVVNNIVHWNGGDGITAVQNSVILENAISGNLGMGLIANNSTAYGNNAINNNTGGTVSGGSQVSGNVCNGNMTCP